MLDEAQMIAESVPYAVRDAFFPLYLRLSAIFERGEANKRFFHKASTDGGDEVRVLTRQGEALLAEVLGESESSVCALQYLVKDQVKMWRGAYSDMDYDPWQEIMDAYGKARDIHFMLRGSGWQDLLGWPAVGSWSGMSSAFYLARDGYDRGINLVATQEGPEEERQLQRSARKAVVNLGESERHREAEREVSDA